MADDEDIEAGEDEGAPPEALSILQADRSGTNDNRRWRYAVRDVGALAVINVTDDGVGGASMAKGHGLAGLADRLAGVDGTLTVSSPAGGPTRLTATIPQHLG